jgi:hypothetical protein
MTKRIILVLFAILILTSFSCITEKSLKGDLTGVVTREGTTQIVPNPVLIAIPVNPTDDIQTQTVTGDSKGRFVLILVRGDYTIKIGTSLSGPFFTWPNTVNIGQSRSSIMAFTIPVDFGS